MNLFNTDAKYSNSKQWSGLLEADKCLKNQSLILAQLLPETRFFVMIPITESLF
jgi:hypothetical protein